MLSIWVSSSVLLPLLPHPQQSEYMDKEIWGQEFISWCYLIGNASLDGQLAPFLMVSYWRNNLLKCHQWRFKNEILLLYQVSFWRELGSTCSWTENDTKCASAPSGIKVSVKKGQLIHPAGEHSFWFDCRDFRCKKEDSWNIIPTAKKMRHSAILCLNSSLDLAIC